jgi:hypothetical protein
MPVRGRTTLEGEDEAKPAGLFGELGKRLARVGRKAGAIAISAVALIFSGVSLYETVLKQADLHLFVPDTIFLTGDPDGGSEVFAVPLTVSNSGARDGIVSALKLEVRNGATDAKQTLEASYFAGPDYFSVKEDSANNIRRPKTPFAPLPVAGRGSHTATVLFYARKYEGQRVVSGGGRYVLLLSAETRPAKALGFFDRLWSTSVAPVRSIYELPPVSQIFEARIYSGNSERMFRVESEGRNQ